MMPAALTLVPKPDPGLASLIDEMAKVYDRFITFPDPDSSYICALWCAQTWLFATQTMHAVYTVGYLAFVSPVPNCGKSTALTITGALSFGRPELTISAKSAPIFRALTEKRTTLIFDELDTIVENPDLIAVLNSGYKKGAKTTRMVGKQYDKVKDFETFGPKAFGYNRDSESLRAIKSALESRCIRIFLTRQTIAERQSKDMIRERTLDAMTAPLAERLMSWQFTVPNDLTPVFNAVVVKDFTGRENEVWENVLAVAYLAGQFERACAIARRIVFRNREDLQDHTKTDAPFLKDLRNNLDRMCDEDGFSMELAAEVLRGLEGRSYGMGVGKRNQPVSASSVASVLAKYGVRSRNRGVRRLRRVARDEMMDLFERHLPLEEE